MHCEGRPAGDYDLYVLGLLDASQTRNINEHVELQCPACLSALKRSTRLWGVFTSSLGPVEPSSHFKQRLEEIVGLSQSVLTFPKQEVADIQHHFPRWAQIIIALTLAAMLTLCGWYAGHTTGSLDHQHLVTQVAQSQEQLSSSELLVKEQQQQRDRVNAALTASGKTDAIDHVANLQDQLLRLQADVTQYKALLARTQQTEDQQKDLLLLLSSRNAKLIPVKGGQSTPASLGYILMIPNSKLVFVASNLTDLPGGREYQLWLLRPAAQKPASAGVFVPDDSGHAYLQVDDGELVGDANQFIVTDEPAGGSTGPTGSRIMTSED